MLNDSTVALITLVKEIDMALRRWLSRYNETVTETVAIVWGHFTNTTSAGSGELTKSAGGSALNALAYSDQTVATNGSVSFVLTDNTGGIFGLSNASPPTAGTYAQINFGLGVPSDGSHTVKVYEGGVDKGNAQTNNGTTDVFSIHVVANVVTYRKNGTTYYTSATSASGLTLKPTADPYTQMQAIVSASIT